MKKLQPKVDYAIFLFDLKLQIKVQKKLTEFGKTYVFLQNSYLFNND